MIFVTLFAWSFLKKLHCLTIIYCAMLYTWNYDKIILNLNCNWKIKWKHIYLKEMWEKALLIKLILIWRQNQFILFKNKKLKWVHSKKCLCHPCLLSHPALLLQSSQAYQFYFHSSRGILSFTSKCTLNAPTHLYTNGNNPVTWFCTFYFTP